MDFKFLTDSIKYIILDPVTAWDTIHSENRKIRFLRINLVLPLIVVASVSAFLGSFFFVTTGISKAFSVLAGIKYFLLFYVVIYGTALIITKVIKALDLGDDFDISFKLVAFSSVPFLLCQIVSRLFESFLFVNILALFGLYIFWTGSEKLLNPTEKKKVQLLIASFVSFILLLFTAGWLLTKVIDIFYFALSA